MIVPFESARSTFTPLRQREHQEGQELQRLQQERRKVPQQQLTSGSFESFSSGLPTEEVSLLQLHQLQEPQQRLLEQQSSFSGNLSSKGKTGEETQQQGNPHDPAAPAAGESLEEWYVDPHLQEHQQRRQQRQQAAAAAGHQLIGGETARPESSSTTNAHRPNTSGSNGMTNLFESALRAEDMPAETVARAAPTVPAASGAATPATAVAAPPRLQPRAVVAPPRNEPSRKRTDTVEVPPQSDSVLQQQQQRQQGVAIGNRGSNAAANYSVGRWQLNGSTAARGANAEAAAPSAAAPGPVEATALQFRCAQRQLPRVLQQQQAPNRPTAEVMRTENVPYSTAAPPKAVEAGSSSHLPCSASAHVSDGVRTQPAVPTAADPGGSSKKFCKGESPAAKGRDGGPPAGAVPRRLSCDLQPDQMLQQEQLQQHIYLQHSDSQSTRATSWGAASVACVDAPPTTAAGAAATAAPISAATAGENDCTGPPPFSPAAVLRCFSWQLTPWERREVFEYRQLWYWGAHREKPAGNEQACRYGGPFAGGAGVNDEDDLCLQAAEDVAEADAAAALAAAVAALPSFGSRRGSKLSSSNRKLMNCTSGSMRSYFCDSRGEYVVSLHDHICYRFQLLELLGTGSFGSVFRALDHKTGEEVALKIIRNKCSFHAQGREEVKALRLLLSLDRDGKGNVVHMKESFLFRGHLVLTFELLSHNLYVFLKKNKFRGFSSLAVRSIAIQLLHALRLLKRAGIVHCDVKPENIALMTDRKSTVKLIDFGSSCREGQQQQNAYIQSRYYRSPEVLLGLPYGTEIDVWSLGCVLAELHTGSPLFPGEDEADQLGKIAGLLGFPPIDLILQSPRKDLFFGGDTEDTLCLLHARRNRRGIAATACAEELPFSTLELAIQPADETFVDFLKGEFLARNSRLLRFSLVASCCPRHGLSGARVCVSLRAATAVAGRLSKGAAAVSGRAAVLCSSLVVY